jgi:hypothetical protein
LESAIKIGKSELGSAIKSGNGSENESPPSEGFLLSGVLANDKVIC